MLKHVNMIQYMYVHYLYCAQVFGGACCWPRRGITAPFVFTDNFQKDIIKDKR